MAKSTGFFIKCLIKQVSSCLMSVDISTPIYCWRPKSAKELAVTLAAEPPLEEVYEHLEFSKFATDWNLPQQCWLNAAAGLFFFRVFQTMAIFPCCVDTEKKSISWRMPRIPTKDVHDHFKYQEHYQSWIL